MAVHVHNAIAKGGDDDENPMEKMTDMFGPGYVGQAMHSVIQACWMALPKDRRNVDEVEKQIRRIMDRALVNLREDASAFGLSA